MKQTIKYLFLGILFLSSLLYAKQIPHDNYVKDEKISIALEQMANATSSSLWNLNRKQLKTTATSYLNNPKIRAIKIYDNLLKKDILIAAQNNNNISYYESNNFEDYLNKNQFNKVSKQIVHNKRIIGKITIYYINNASKIKFTKEEMQWIKDHPRIKVHSEKDWAPFNYIEDGKSKGYSTDYIKLLAKKIGIEIEFIQGHTWNEYLQMLKDKQIDLISNMVETPLRKDYALFSKRSIHTIAPAIYAKRGAVLYNNLKSLENKKVAIIKGFWQEELIKRNYPKINILSVNSTLEAIKAVANSQADAIIDVGPVIQSVIMKNAIPDIIFQGVTDFRNSDMLFDKIGIRKDWPILKSILDKTIESLTYQEKQNLHQVWFVNNSKNQIQKTILLDSSTLKTQIEQKLFKKSDYTPLKHKKRKKVLLLHSYHAGYKWTDDITAGIKAMFPKDSNVTLSIEYMDTKRKFDEKYLNLLKENYEYRYKNESFDLIIASDNNAINFLIENRNSIFSKKTPIVFCGANFFEKSHLKGAKNITGVSEEPDIKATLETAINLHPQAKNIFIVNDTTVTGKLVAKKIYEIEKEFAYKDINFIYSKSYSMNELLLSIKTLPKNTIIFFHNFFKDKNGIYYNINEATKLISQSTNLPIYAGWDFVLGNGVIGGKLETGFTQGLEVAKISHRVLSGENINKIPVVKNNQSNQYIFDQRVLDKFGIRSNRLPLDSIIINAHNKHLAQNKKFLKTLSKEELDFLDTVYTIKAANFNYLPFSFNENNQEKGFSIDFFNMLSEIIGLRVQYIHNDSFKEQLEDLQNKRIDVFPTIAYVKDREKFVNYTNPYYSFYIGLAVKKDSNISKSLESFNGKKIAVIEGYFLELLLKKHYPNIEIYRVKHAEEALEAVSLGKADAAINMQPTLNFHIQRNFMNDLTAFPIINNKHFKKTSGYIGVRKDWPILRNIIQKAINFSNKSEVNKLVTNWLGESSNSDNIRITLSKKEKEFLLKNQSIKVSNEVDWPPFDFAVGNQPQGYFIDLLELISKRTGLKFEYTNGYAWYELYEKFKNEEIDLLHPVNKTEDREKLWIFSKPAFSYKTVFAQKKNKSPIKSIKDLYGKTIGIGKDFAYEEFLLNNYPQIIVKTYKNTQEALDMLSKGFVDAVVDSEPVLKYLLKKNFYSDINVKGWFKEFDKNTKARLHFMTHEDKPELVSMINKALEIITPGELQELEQKWFAVNTLKNSKRVELTKEEITYLKSKQNIRFCALPDAMPYEAIDKNSKHIGIANDIVKLLERKLNIPFELHATKTWTQSHEAIKNELCEILPFAQNLPYRKDYLNFTKPYFTQTTVIATRTEELFVNNLEQIKNQKIAIIEKYAYADLIKKQFPNIQIIPVNSIQEGLELVRTKKAYGYVDNLGSIGHELQRQGNFEIKIAGKIGFDLQLSVAIDKNEALLTSILSKTIDSFSQEELKEIYNKWITVKYEDKIDYTLIYQVMFIAFLILSGTIVWNRKLRIEISKRLEIEKQLRIARKDAIKASKAKSEFLANMSHEIRTPMNGIMGMTTLALGNIEKDPTMAKEYMKKSQNSAKMLLEIINDILDFSKIEAGKLELEIEAMSLRETISRLNDLFGYMAKQKDLEFIIEQDELIPEYILADQLRLTQVLTNLASNAIKFTKEGFVKIKVELISKDHEFITLKFSVIDSGKGISKKNQQRLFKSFSQEDISISKNYGGTGLGLAISKELVELMGGEIAFDSVENEGSNFHFTLNTKLANIQTSTIKKTDDNLDVSKFKMLNSRVLLVEDNEINIELAYNFIKEIVTHIDIARNGQEALDLIKKHESNYYDLILMDIHMPIMDGYTATKQIKKLEKYKKLPIIAITANALKSDIKKSLDTGMCDHIPKPFDVRELHTKIHYWIKKDKKTKELNDYILEEKRTVSHKIFLDTQTAINRMVGRSDLYKNFLEGFLKNRTEEIKDIEELINSKNYIEAKNKIHSLKGIVNTMGAQNFGDFLLECENLLEKEQFKKEHFDRLKKNYEDLKQQVTNYLKSN